MSKKTNATRAAEVREILVQRFPLAFMPKRSPKKPLKIGIYIDVVHRCHDIGRYRIKLAIADYCNGPTYLRAMFPGAIRFDLDGNAAGDVTESHAAHASEKLQNMQARWEAQPHRDAAE